MRPFKFQMGDVVKDRITGYTGVIVMQSRHITGCDRYLVQPKCEDGKENDYKDGKFFDETQLKVTGQDDEVLAVHLSDQEEQSSEGIVQPRGPVGDPPISSNSMIR